MSCLTLRLLCCIRLVLPLRNCAAPLDVSIYRAPWFCETTLLDYLHQRDTLLCLSASRARASAWTQTFCCCVAKNLSHDFLLLLTFLVIFGSIKISKSIFII